MEYQNIEVSGSTLAGKYIAPSSLAETLFMMSCALLAPGQYRITTNCEAGQVTQMGRLLEHHGLFIGGTRRYFVDVASQQLHQSQPDFLDSYNLPAALFILAPMLHRFGQAAIFLPDLPGSPVWYYDQLLSILSRFGARGNLSGGLLELRCRGLKGTTVTLPPECFLLSAVAVQTAVLAAGESVIRQASTTGEFVNCCRSLQKMGAMIEGVGTTVLRVTGVNALAPQNLTAAMDNRQLLVVFWAAVLTSSRLEFADLETDNISVLISAAEMCGAQYTINNKSFVLDGYKGELAATLFADCRYPALTLPALLLLGARQHREFRLVSANLAPLVGPLQLLERLGLRISHIDDTLICHSGGGMSPFSALAADPLSAIWLLWGGLVVGGTSTIYNGAIMDRLFSNLDLQLTRLDGRVIRLPKDPT